MSCPNCKKSQRHVFKVIAYGMPMMFCRKCSCLWGFWSYVYVHIFSKIDAYIDGGFSFFIYKGSYLRGLYHYFRGSYKRQDRKEIS